MSTIAYRAALVREIEQAMERLDARGPAFDDDFDFGYHEGQLEAYAHVLLLVKGDDL